MIASDIDVPWAIALVSDHRARAPKPSRRITVVEREPILVKPDSTEADGEIQVVMDHGHADAAKPSVDEKPVTPKACSGVVNRRS